MKPIKRQEVMHIEDLKRNDMIAIVKCHDTGHASTCCLHGAKCQQVQYDGSPLKVIAVSPPFVFVFDPANRKHGSIDSRRFEFTRLSKEYMQAVEQFQDTQRKIEQVTVKCSRCGFDNARVVTNT